MTDDPLRHIPWERWPPENPVEGKAAALRSLAASRQAPRPQHKAHAVAEERQQQRKAGSTTPSRRSGRRDLNAAKAKSAALHYIAGEGSHQAYLHRKAQLSAQITAWESGVAPRARRKTRICATCVGTGNMPGTGIICPTCVGSGRVPVKRGPIGAVRRGGPEGSTGSTGGGTSI